MLMKVMLTFMKVQRWYVVCTEEELTEFTDLKAGLK